MVGFSQAQRVEMIFLYGECSRNARHAATAFAQKFPDIPAPAHTTIQRLVAKFQLSGSVADAPRSGKPKYATDEVHQLEVVARISADPCLSSRRLGQASGISHQSVLRILHKNSFKPYKMKILQELTEDDPDRRLDFCEQMANMLMANPSLLYGICFSDEATFMLNGQVNRHNCRFWSTENPHLFREGHTQHPQKLNVWAGILGRHIIGPFYIEGNLNGPMYRDLLEHVICPALSDILQHPTHPPPVETPPTVDNVMFQQDGAPAHYAAVVREFLDGYFPHRWIGRRGSVEWPARSPDLSPLDFFLWGHLKSRVYATQPNNIGDLRQRISDECALITPDDLDNVLLVFERRLYECQTQDGGHFEQLH